MCGTGAASEVVTLQRDRNVHMNIIMDIIILLCCCMRLVDMNAAVFVSRGNKSRHDHQRGRNNVTTRSVDDGDTTDDERYR